jgi:DnaA family protein
MNAPRQLTLDLVRPPTPSLDNFVVGRNAEAVAALRAVAAGGGESFVYLFGEDGCGRTHLLTALAAATGAAPPAATVPAFDAAQRLYLVDDVDRCGDDAQQRLFVLLNEVRARPGAALVAAGSAPPAQLPLRDDIRTRLAWGLVYPLHALTDADKARALDDHARSRGFALPPDVAGWLLTHMPRDMRTLVAIVDALDRYALARKRPITVPLVREWAQAPA